jgi:hypothetical protein
MGTKFTYAIALTIGGAVFNLVMYFLGFQTDKMASGQLFQWVGLIITIVILWLGIKAVREESPDKSLTYGQGVGAGTLISVYSGLMSAVYTYIHFKFINPAFFEYQAAMMHEKMVAQGRTDAQIEQAEAMMNKFSGPIVSAIFTPVIVIIFGLIISLVLAAILKRAPTATPPAAA